METRMAEPVAPPSSDDAVTVILRGYFSRQLPSGGKTFTLRLADVPTPRTAAVRLSVPLPAIGLVLINRQQASMDTPLHPSDVLEFLPLLGGGATP
jgi:hypothetical protein